MEGVRKGAAAEEKKNAEKRMPGRARSQPAGGGGTLVAARLAKDRSGPAANTLPTCPDLPTTR